MTRETSHEYSYSQIVQSAHDERAEALARAAYLAIAGADRAVRGAFAAVGAGLSSLAWHWQQYSERRATYLALSKLDDRLLKDIGLTRADVEGRPSEFDDRAPDVAPTVVAAPVARPAATIHEFKRAA
jgi:uncharacterized protein YjiS (DUF1127 family)